MPTKNMIAACLLVATVAPSVFSSRMVSQPNAKKQAKEFTRQFFSAIKRIRKEHVNPASESQMIRWGIRGLYSALKEPLPKQISSRLNRLQEMAIVDRNDFVTAAHFHLGRRRKIEKKNDLEIALNSIFMKLEPGIRKSDRSQYYPVYPESWPDLFATVGRPTSIGVIVETDPTTGWLKIVTPILNSPAYKARLRGGDLITQIRVDTKADGTPLAKPRCYSTKGMSAKHAEKILLGKYGTRVRVTIIPAHAAIAKKR